MAILLLVLTIFCFHVGDSANSLILTPNATVDNSKNGNVRDYTSIQKAIDDAPINANYRYVIHIKRGVYKEKVDVPKEKPNLTLFGDGKGLTVITGKLHSNMGKDIQHSATLRVDGSGFMAINLTVENNAGRNGSRAVAIHSRSPYSAFYHLSIKGFQDTLYVQEGPQFYRECDISGTIDFIFGEGPVVFQKCQILARHENEHKVNVITANGCVIDPKPHRACGFSFHQCSITGDKDLLGSKSRIPTYLGRPWQNGSRTIFMESYMSQVINPAGWLDFDSKIVEKEMFYAEFKNSGEGAATNNRVNWPGVHRIIRKRIAEKYTVSKFLKGEEWLPNLHIPYIPGLL
ncbi:Plant invertase/pectin methylesterase inhibitor superfamily [Euphorbia peplus]|nr:Plant invertase/pectin methylesterase inhibitor superfamily [Euphorbia peplus]